MSAPEMPMPPASRAQALQVGGYTLTGLIGSGALGTVHRALGPASADTVAVKLVRLPVGSVELAEARRRFLAEADAARRLQHPGIVRTLAAGEDAGRGWLAMELLAGHNLQRHTQADALLPQTTVLHIATQLADALDHAHRRGVLHRDLKPANVMFDPATGRATLTDFGLARLADAEHTRTGMLLGTPAYMAPELLAGSPPSAASDVYALGVLLFELLAGRLPYTGATMGALLRQVASTQAPALASLRADVPAGVSDMVAQLLDKSPRHRPADAAALAERLRVLSVPDGAADGHAGVAAGV